MMMKKLIFILLFSSSLVFASSKKLGEVKIVKGEATLLYLGDTEAVPVKVGSPVFEDTSIVTKSKSFVRVLYHDKSTMSIKPKTKIIVRSKDLDKKSVSMIGLLKGKIRAYVKKKKTKNVKMFVKTKSAVMGIRGTEFEVLHNAATERSTLVTYDGEVEMTKVKNSKPVGGPVKVEAGHASSVTEEPKAQLVKQRVDPEQFEVLKKTEPLTEDAVSIPQSTPTTSKAGSLVDMNSGVIVAPKSETEKNGSFNQETGEYVPPKGKELDQASGKLVDKEEEIDNTNLEVEEIESKRKISYQLFAGYVAEHYSFKGATVDTSGDINSNSAVQLALAVTFETKPKTEYYFKPVIKLSDFDDPVSTTHEKSENTLGQLLLGYKYQYSDFSKVIAEIGIQDEFLVNIYTKTGSSNYFSSFETVLVPRVSIGYEYQKEVMRFVGQYIQKLGDGDGMTKAQSANGIELQFHFSFSDRYGLYSQILSEKIKGETTESDHSQFTAGLSCHW